MYYRNAVEAISITPRWLSFSSLQEINMINEQGEAHETLMLFGESPILILHRC